MMGKNKTRIDVMVDIETLGTGVDAIVFQIASAAFDINTGKITASIEECADISEMTAQDGVIDGRTLKWWMGSNKELFAELLDKGDTLTPYGLMVNYHRWLDELTLKYDEVYLWGNGILFDNNIIRHKFESYGWKYPIHFRNDRDVRTIFEIAQHKTGESAKEMYERIYDKELVSHDAMNDVKNQIALVTECYSALTKGERKNDE